MPTQTCSRFERKCGIYLMPLDENSLVRGPKNWLTCDSSDKMTTSLRSLSTGFILLLPLSSAQFLSWVRMNLCLHFLEKGQEDLGRADLVDTTAGVLVLHPHISRRECLLPGRNTTESLPPASPTSLSTPKEQLTRLVRQET